MAVVHVFSVECSTGLVVFDIFCALRYRFNSNSSFCVGCCSMDSVVRVKQITHPNNIKKKKKEKKHDNKTLKRSKNSQMEKIMGKAEKALNEK